MHTIFRVLFGPIHIGEPGVFPSVLNRETVPARAVYLHCLAINCIVIRISILKLKDIYFL